MIPYQKIHRGEEEAFFVSLFEVFSNKDVLGKIKSYMYPGKRTCNFYEYVDGDMAAFYGYLSLIKEKRKVLLFSRNCVRFAAEGGHLETTKYIHEKSGSRRAGDGAMVAAIKGKNMEVIDYVHKNVKDSERTDNAMWEAAVEIGKLRILRWTNANAINHDKHLPLILSAVLIKRGNLRTLEWLQENKSIIHRDNWDRQRSECLFIACNFHE